MNELDRFPQPVPQCPKCEARATEIKRACKNCSTITNARIDKLEADLAEQYRLLGLDAERELKLMAERDEQAQRAQNWFQLAHEKDRLADRYRQALEQLRQDRTLWKAGGAGGCDKYQGLPPGVRLIDEVLKGGSK